MDIQTFISNYQEAFGMQAGTPHHILVLRQIGSSNRESKRLLVQMHEVSQRRKESQP